MKEIFPRLFGNEKLKNTLGCEILNGKQSHAYIIEGAGKSGKMTAALSAAAALSCENRNADGVPLPCGECNSCRKVFKGISPDVFVISAGERKSVGVESIRELKSSLYEVPNDGDYKVYIIDDAQLMTTQAQNALLISLEEPPPFAVFFLLTQDAQALLETVRSRSPIIRMEKLTPERIGEFLAGRPELKDNPLRAEMIKEICMMSAPSAGRALELVSLASSKSAAKDGEEKRKHAAAFCTALICGSHADILDAVRAFPKGRDNVRDILLLCGDALRDVMTARCAPGAGTLFFTSADDAAALARKTTAARLSSLFSAIDEYAELLRRNANETVVTTLLCML